MANRKTQRLWYLLVCCTLYAYVSTTYSPTLSLSLLFVLLSLVCLFVHCTCQPSWIPQDNPGNGVLVLMSRVVLRKSWEWNETVLSSNPQSCWRSFLKLTLSFWISGFGVHACVHTLHNALCVFLCLNCKCKAYDLVLRSFADTVLEVREKYM